MNFKTEETFEHYWPPLPEEKFIILEKSILEEGLRENLIVWKEKNVLLDGHQRLRVLKKHGIPFDDRVTYLSFPDEVHAKHWIHITQTARRGDAPQFLSICHVMEFEDVYREEAKKRQVFRGKLLKTKQDASGIIDAEQIGRSRNFMARDAAVGAETIRRVLYIEKNDSKKFKELRKRAMAGEEISIFAEFERVFGAIKVKKAGLEIDTESLEKLRTGDEIRDFSEATRKFKAPIPAQKAAAEAIIQNKKTVDKNWIEDEIMHRLPKREPKKEIEKSGLAALKEKMAEIAIHIDKASLAIRELQELREKSGDDIYFRAIAAMPEIRAAFVRFMAAAKSFQNGGSIEQKEKKVD